MTLVSLHNYEDGRPFAPALFQRAETDMAHFMAIAAPIIADVKANGDDALIRYAQKFDGVTAESFNIKATEAEFDEAFTQVDPALIETLTFAIENIRSFHTQQLPPAMEWHEIRPGAFAADRFLPLDSVACYVPRGKGAFPSVVMMTTVPALVAGVLRPLIITPPTPDGKVDAATLVAARLAGITEVYKCGGAQGVAAVAYGTESVPAVHKIVGPGSPYVGAAKRLLADIIDPGLPAGPSESIILADETTDGALAALDLLIESEHGPDSAAYLVTNSEAVAQAALAALPGYWATMPAQRAGFSQSVLGGKRGGIVITKSFADAIAFTNAFAPEHLEVLAANPHQVLEKLRHAGEILLGPHTPISMANFVLGPNAVLPTGGAARTWGPLSVTDFMKRTSVGHVTQAGFAAMAAHGHRLALYEGFTAHANALSKLRAVK
jgi:histidinol dehydrogenase